MDLEDKNLSLQFYKYLCDIVGSVEVVRTRREIFTAKEIVENTSFATSISSGSKAEGLDLKGSDYDQMLLPNFIRVYESLNCVQSDPDKLLLVMETDEIKLGFTRLKLVDKSNLYILNDWCETVGEETYISSKRFREEDLSDDMVIHGPCQSSADMHYDQAKCFRCYEWIAPAHQWIHRSRTTWPDCTLVNSAVQYGVLFVPIGCKNSPNEDLQWRISFSVTEKLLIHSFTHTQFLCYALLKTILKDIIKPKHGELLCSYFLKTIMFWISEEVIPSKWKPENMISCFLDCVRRLIYCVEYKTCLHYFIPEYNLFADRFTEEEHKTLMCTLKSIYGSSWTSIFQTELFLNYRLQSVNSQSMALSGSALSCFSYIRVFYNPHSIYSVFKRLRNGFNYILKKEMCAYILCVYSMESIQSSDFLNLADKNKSYYKQYKRMFCHFKIGLQSDSICSWLLLASFFYNSKRFEECIDIINYSLSRCTPDKIHLLINNSLTEQTVFEEMKQKLGLLHAFKYLMSIDVCFQYPFCLVPDELIPLINDTTCCIPPDVYSYLLQFLCYHHLADYRRKQNALQNLEVTIRERYLKKNFEIVHRSLEIVRALI